MNETVLGYAKQHLNPLYPAVLGTLTPLLIEPLIGARYLSTARWLPEFYSWSLEERQAWQQPRLEAVTEHAVRQVDFYRAQFGADADLSGLPLKALPVVDKAFIRERMDAFLPRDWRRLPKVMKRTGGTTGEAWEYPLDKRAWANLYGAFLHFLSLTGYRYGERIVMLGAPPSLVSDDYSLTVRLRNLIERRFISTTGVALNHAPSLKRAQLAGAAGGAVWYGYAGTVAAMARAALADDLRVRTPRAIVTTAETLLPEWRKQIEQAFQTDVFDQYGCNDGGILTQSCWAGRFHVAENCSIVEVLDGTNTCPPGVEGDVTVTNLHAMALPFLRYNTGDRAALASGRCPCGRDGVTLELVRGRAWPPVRLPNGGEVSCVPLSLESIDCPNVRRVQLVQHDASQLVVRLDVQSEFTEGEAERLRRFLRRQLGEEIDVRLTTTEPIELTSGGKHNFFVQTVK